MTSRYLYIGVALISTGLAVGSIFHSLALYITGDLISICGIFAFYKAIKILIKEIDKGDH